MLFEEAVHAYIETKAKRLRATTMEGYESAIRCHLIPRWEGVDLADITPEALQEWVDGFDLPGAADKAFKTLRQVIRWTIRAFQLRMWDPTTADIAMPRKAPYRPRVLSAREEKSLLRGIYGAPFEAVVLCAAALGLRRCEACALEWSDVDFRSGRVHVQRGAHVVHGSEVVTPPKTDLSDRVLVLPAFALKRLRQIASGRRSGRMCAMRPDQLARAFKSWCRRLRLPWVPMQSLRHTWATISIGHGVPLEDVALCLGHSTPETCYQHYLVRTQEICKRVSRGFSEALLAA